MYVNAYLVFGIWKAVFGIQRKHFSHTSSSHAKQADHYNLTFIVISKTSQYVILLFNQVVDKN